MNSNSSSPLVTIGIPTYNRVRTYLKGTIHSALVQSYENVDIVIADNSSTDGTEEYIHSLRDSRIRYFKHDKNIGPIKNFTYCLEKARGTYFLLLNDDDMIDSDFIECTVKSINENSEIGFAKTGYRLIDSNGDTVMELCNHFAHMAIEDYLLQYFQNKFGFIFCNTLFHTDRLRSIGGFNTKTGLAVDVITTSLMAIRYKRVDIKDPKASMRRHDQTWTSIANFKDWIDDHKYLYELICRNIPNIDTQYKKEILSGLTEKDYMMTNHIKPMWNRMRLFMYIYSTFGYCYSPFKWIYNIHVRPRISKKYVLGKINSNILKRSI